MFFLFGSDQVITLSLDPKYLNLFIVCRVDNTLRNKKSIEVHYFFN